MIRLFILVEDVTAVMAAGFTTIRVYTDVSSTGTFVTLDGTTALVAGQESYEYTDTNGTDALWYKTAYYGIGPGESDMSPARKGETASAYGTVKELRAHMDKSAIADDWELAQLLDAAADNINRTCNRPDGFVSIPVATARTYPGSGTDWQWIDECTSLTQLRVKQTSTSTYDTWTTSDYMTATGDPRYPDYNSTPKTALYVDPNGDYSVFYKDGAYPTVEVTAYWGYATTVPDDIRMACVMQAARWYKRLQSAMADSAASADLGMLLYRQSLDPDIKRILVEGRYVKPALGRR